MAENSVKDLNSLTAKELYNLKLLRWRARTDLGFLCREVLGYRNVSYNMGCATEEEGGPTDPIHQPVIDLLQKFPQPNKEQFEENDQLIRGRWQYKPLRKLMNLEGHRRMLLLDPRGHLKTSINIISHTIQWIINYPDIAMLLVQSTDKKSSDNLSEIKRHFTSNPRFRQLFPEHCPKKTDWGTTERFTTEARGPEIVRREPTVQTGSIEKGAAGLHFDVIKFSDIVEPTTVKGMGLQNVKNAFYMAENLLVSPSFWIDVEGTRYHDDDLYGDIIRTEAKIKPEKRQYKIHVRGIYYKDLPNPKFSVDELKAKNKLESDGQPIVLWPQRFTPDHVATMQLRDPFSFATQQLNDPSAVAGEIYFPVNEEFPRWIKRDTYKQNVRIAYREITVDTAETDNQRSNYSVITTAAWDSAGRTYVEKIERGRWQPSVLVSKIILAGLNAQRDGNLRQIKIEKTSFVRGLMTSLNREIHVKGLWFPIELIPRDTQQAKTERIMLSLQTPYRSKNIVFLDDLGYPNPVDEQQRNDTRAALISELEAFPMGRSDDILDTLADLFQNKEWSGRESARKTYQQAASDAWDRALDIDCWENDPAYGTANSGESASGFRYSSVK